MEWRFDVLNGKRAKGMNEPMEQEQLILALVLGCNQGFTQ